MRKILALDDSPVVLKMVERTIRKLGFEPVTAKHGEEGLTRFEEHDITLIVTDINMPVMNGIEFIRALRKRDARVPVLVLTTESDENLMREAEEAGSNGWIGKPPVPEELRDHIRRLLPEPAAEQPAAFPLL